MGVGSGFTVDFDGTSIDWMALTGPIYGIAQVELDGVLQPDVDLYSANYLFQQVVFSKTGLAAGPHTMVVNWTGRRNAAPCPTPSTSTRLT